MSELSRKEFEQESLDEVRNRITHLKKVLANPQLKLYEYEMCKRNIAHFCNNWCWTYNPKEPSKHYPFALFDFQEEMIIWINQRYRKQEIGVIEKSREMGASWLISVWALHQFIFAEGFTCLFASRVESDVDDSTVDSIFGKIRYNLYRLPRFLKPNMNAVKTGRRIIEPDSRLRLINKDKDNEIKGSSTNSNLGRGGRRSIVFLDEFAFVENSDAIWASVSQVADCIIPYSTANGKANQFYRLTQNKNIEKLTLHWNLHPLKDQKWYERKKQELEPHQLAQEIDIDYLASRAGRVYKRADRRYHVSKEIIYPNKYFEQFITWDFGIADLMVMIFGQITPTDSVEIYAAYANKDQDIDFYLPMTLGKRPNRNYWDLLPEKEQKEIDNLLKKVFSDNKNGEKHILEFSHYGDFAGTQRGANSRFSIKQRMQSPPYEIDFKSSPNQSFSNRIQCFDNLLKLKQDKYGDFHPRFQISREVNLVIDAIFNYIWDKEDVNDKNIKPKHDEFSHPMSALEFFAINRYPLQDKSKSHEQRFR